MEAKLIKVDNGWVLMVDNIMYATDNDKLSLKNCEAIANGYDLDELAYSHLVNINDSTISTSWQGYTEDIFKAGFQKALELMDKKFSEGQMKSLFAKTLESSPSTESHTRMISDTEYRHFLMDKMYSRIIKSLYQTEWDVEVEMECLDKNCDGINRKGCCIPGDKPKIDSEGYLILKRL